MNGQEDMKTLYESIMESIGKVVKRTILLIGVEGEIEAYLNRCMFGYVSKSKKSGEKAEILLQHDIVKELQKEHKRIKNPSKPIDLKSTKICPKLKEKSIQYDIEVMVGTNNRCLIEIKYDEVDKDGVPNNSDSENQVIRDLYKLEGWKKKHKEDICCAVFVTNKKSHWEKFTSIKSGAHDVHYGGEIETISLSRSYSIVWKQAEKKKDYRYCFIEV